MPSDIQMSRASHARSFASPAGHHDILIRPAPFGAPSFFASSASISGPKLVAASARTPKLKRSQVVGQASLRAVGCSEPQASLSAEVNDSGKKSPATATPALDRQDAWPTISSRRPASEFGLNGRGIVGIILQVQDVERGFHA